MAIIRSPKSRVSFISSLELASPSERGEKLVAPQATADGERSFVDAGSTMSFVQALPLLKQQDVLNSTLLAQLAANAQFDREKETAAWYAFYRTVLENVGWVLENFGFSRFTTANQELRIDRAAIAILRAIMSGDELQILETTLKALEELPENEGALSLFDSQASKSEGGNFQLGTASPDPSGNVVMSLGSFYFQATEHRNRFLFVTWKTSSINLFTSAQKIILNEQIYSTVRQAVIEKLGKNALDFIDLLQL